MAKLLIDDVDGLQKIIEVEEGGGYFDQSRVLWDDRIDGQISTVSIGGLIRNGDALVFDKARKDAHDASMMRVSVAVVESKIDTLWRAADKYVSGYISGVAIGLLTLGMVQGKPKALAVTAWSSAVWDAYYARKAMVTSTSMDDLDFTSLGPMPHTVPELRAELGL